MRLLLCLSCLLSVATTAPLTDQRKGETDRQQAIRQYWGEGTNVTRTEAIFKEEGAKLGLTTQEMFQACAAEMDEMMLTQEEEADIRQEIESAIQLGSFNVTSTAEMFKILRNRFPKTYSALGKRQAIFDKYYAKLDADAQSFVRNLGSTTLDYIKAISSSDSDQKSIQNPLEFLPKMGKIVTKVKSDYDALPQSSKDSLERNFCVITSLRIADEDGALSMILAMMEAVAGFQ